MAAISEAATLLLGNDAAPITLKAGDEARALWKMGRKWYKTTVLAVNDDDGTYFLRYEDGDEWERVPADRIRLADGTTPLVASAVEPMRLLSKPSTSAGGGGAVAPAPVSAPAPATATAAVAAAAAVPPQQPLPSQRHSSQQQQQQQQQQQFQQVPARRGSRPWTLRTPGIVPQIKTFQAAGGQVFEHEPGHSRERRHPRRAH